MARIRSIHYDALKSEKLAAASAEAERLYWRLQTHCDDEGRAEDDPRLFAAYLFPLNDEVVGSVVDGWLDELDRLGLIVRYEADGNRYLAVTKWEKYQRPQKRRPSILPPPPDEPIRVPVRDEGCSSPVGGYPGGEGSGGEIGGESVAPAERSRDELFDALTDVCGIDADQLTRSARGALNAARKQLADLGATDEDVRRKAAAYRVEYPTATLTPSALAKHWPALNGVTPMPVRAGPEPSVRIGAGGQTERFFPGTGWVSA